MPTAGEIDCRFKYQRRTQQADGYGNFQGGWQTQFTLWTRRSFLRGGESVMAARLQGRQPCILKIRLSPEASQITTDWRAVNADDEAEVWNIRSVQSGNRRDEIEFLAERGVASG